MADADTQHQTVSPIDERTRCSTGTAQWLLECPQDRIVPIYHKNVLDVHICGEDAFKQIASDLKRARKSVEIVCWGFDPAMELVRTGDAWPRGDTWGDLLRNVAAGKYNGGRPVQVRLLSWYGVVGSSAPLIGVNNMPGYSKGDLTYADRMRRQQVIASGGVFIPIGAPPQPTNVQDRREDFNASWYQEAFGGRMANLCIRTRDGDRRAVSESLRDEPGTLGFVETAGMERIPTDHQKTILIDYDHEGGASAVGYVMGLNSVTDYWDTQEHLYEDPRRGESWEGGGDGGGPGLKPYQDYACRIRGAALVAVSKNFTDAWNRAKGAGSNLSREHDLQQPPPGLVHGLRGVAQRAQIVRTQPEDKEKTIRRLYRQATSFARHYIYVENQYFQYAEWATQLKQERASYARGWQAGGRSAADLPSLHVMAVIPTPEHGFMVPRTYDTVKALGQGASVPNQDRRVEEELAVQAREQAAWDEYMARTRKTVKADPYGAALGVGLPPPKPAPLSPQAQSAKAVGDKATIARGMEQMGLRALVASLWSCQAARPSKYREIYIHSKLMIIDDSFFTLGSANLNLRSMAVDAEINVGSDDVGKSTDLRRRVWGLHTAGADKCNPDELTAAAMKVAFDAWEKLMASNAKRKTDGRPLIGFLVPFHDERTSFFRAG